MCPAKATPGAARHDEPLFPREVMFHRQPVAWVLGETLEAAQRGAARVRVEYEPLPAILTIEQAIDAGSFLTEPLRLTRGDVSAHRRRARCGFDGELAIGGQEHFYLETQAAIAWLDESGGVVGALVDAASVGDAGHRRARARPAAQSGDGRVPAHGRRVRRQGSAGQPVGRRSPRSAPGRPAGRCACG